MTGIQPIPFWLESTYASGALVIGVGISWILITINRPSDRKAVTPTLILSLIFSIGSYFPNFIARDYQQIYAGGVFVGIPGFGLKIYTFFFLSGAFLILWKLIKAKKETADPEKKLQFYLIFIGTLILVLVSAFTSFIFPLLYIFSLGGLDSIGLLFFLFFIAYAITKHHLFNIKVVASELLIFTLWIFIFTRIIVANNLHDVLTEAGLFTVSVIIGVLLIKSVLKEVSQRERIERLVIQLKNTNEDLGYANEHLKDLDKLKSEFVSLATHQIRGPLTAIKGYISMIKEGDYGDVSKQVLDPLDVVFQSTNNLVEIVNDFLNVSRIEQGKMKYEYSDFDLRGLVEEVVKEYKPIIESKGLRLGYSEESGSDYMVHADQGKIKQVVGNVIDNAAKYTPKGGIEVSLTRMENKLRIAVTDTGVGINPKTMPKLFQKFTRAENANETNILGTGLGLYVAKQLIEAQQGRIWAESAGDGKGSQFYIELKALK